MRHSIGQYILATIFIGMGVLLILANFEIVTFNINSVWINLYPALFIVLGIKLMIDRSRYRGGSWVFGSFLFIFGGLLMLDRFGVFAFEFGDAFKLWPLLIVYLGFAFIDSSKRNYKRSFARKRGKAGYYYYGPYDYKKHYYGDDHSDDEEKNEDEHDFSDAEHNEKVARDEGVYDGNKMKSGNTTDSDETDQKGQSHKRHHSEEANKRKSNIKRSSFMFGDHEYSRENWKVEPMHLNNLAGDFYMDFTKAFIPEKEVPITISALAGDVRILMPENVAFRVNAKVRAGDIDILGENVDGINRSFFYETDDYGEVSRKLHFTIKLQAGSVRIDHV